MKRIFKALTVALLIIGMSSTLAISAFAWKKTIGSTTEGIAELTESTDNPDMTKLLSQGLSSSSLVTTKDLLATKYYSAENALFTAQELAEIGNHFKYGISAIGVKRLGRPVSAFVDGYFAVGSAGAATVSGMAANGAFAFVLDDNTYNVKGESVPDTTETMPEGYNYKLLVTLNFGAIANLESFAFVHTAKTIVPQSADIYVSDDGENWTLVGYYDRGQRMMDSQGKSDYAWQKGSLLGKDVNGSSYSETGKSQGYMLRFDLPEGTSGQFIRIACNTVDAKTSTPGEYGDNLVAVGDENTVREMFVWGTLTDQVGYTYKEGDGDYVDPSIGDDKGTEEVTTEEPNEIVTKPQDKETTAEPTTPASPIETTNDISTSTSTGEAPSNDIAGCQSVVDFAIVPILALGGVVIAIKRRRKE